VILHASSSAPDTDFFARLIDVAPDGTNRDIASGMVRARYRDGLDKPKLLKPGETVEYRINLRPTSNEFQAGHRIRLDITSSDFPNFDRNHNTAADQNADAKLEVATQTVHHGAAAPSRLLLPVIAAGSR
jgi:putative CocE/NonD family hydrolase